MPQVIFPHAKITVSVPAGTLLIDAIRQAGLSVDAPCGGRGRCGKCAVHVLHGSASSIELSCQFPVTEDLQVYLPDNSMKGHILESGMGKTDLSSPNVYSVNAKIPAPQIGESDSICRRVKDTLNLSQPIPLSLSTNLYHTLKELDFTGDFVLVGDRLSDIRKDKTPCYILAYDIGTTTVVSYLLDSATGRQLSVSSMLNPQTTYGADVISRCEYDTSHQGKELTRLIRSTLNTLMLSNAQKAGISPEDIFFAVIVGNTCMEHLYLGVSTESLISAPYLATVDEIQFLTPSEAQLSIHPEGRIAVLPSISGFVGGDTVGVLLSLPENTFDKMTLILDIGTNGELVLGRGKELYTCSTAAGPAFEGAKIACGMRGTDGAIDHAFVKDGELTFTTVGNLPPAGICGSGLIDLIRCLLELGIISARGRMEKPSKWLPEAAARYSQRLTQINGVSAFLLTDDPKGIYLSQKDIREVQLAKAAIATGVTLLCEQFHVQPEAIQSVLLAGAFGNYMAPESACQIGLIPACLKDRIHPIGNAAGEGAKMAALNRNILERASHIAKHINFVELATSKTFQTAYLQNLNF